MVQYATLIRIVSVQKTLENLPVGEPKVIRNKDIAESVIRSTITRLSKKGYSFYLNNTINGTEIKRLK